jgi:hypothetical protein
MEIFLEWQAAEADHKNKSPSQQQIDGETPEAMGEFLQRQSTAGGTRERLTTQRNILQVTNSG